MVIKYVIIVSIIWLKDNIYSRNTWFPTADVQTQNIGKLRYANRRAPTKCQHTIATQATEYQRWRDVGCRSRRCRPMPTLGQRRNASWDVLPPYQWQTISQIMLTCWHLEALKQAAETLIQNTNNLIQENAFEKYCQTAEWQQCFSCLNVFFTSLFSM